MIQEVIQQGTDIVRGQYLEIAEFDDRNFRQVVLWKSERFYFVMVKLHVLAYYIDFAGFQYAVVCESDGAFVSLYVRVCSFVV